MHLRFLEIHDTGKPYRDRLYSLYDASFPRLERKPVSSLEKTFSEGKNTILAIVDGEEFVGLAVVMTNGRLYLLDYLAIEPDKRDQGYGGCALRRLLADYADRPFVVEIECLDEKAGDNAERQRRRSFYLANGLESSGVFVWLFHVEYELLCANGSVRFEDYRRLLSDCMGGRVKPFVRRIE